MESFIAYALLLLSVGLFAYFYGKSSSEGDPLDIGAKVSGVVTLLLTLIIFVLPALNNNSQTSEFSEQSITVEPEEPTAEPEEPEPEPQTEEPEEPTPKPEEPEPQPEEEELEEEEDEDQDFIPDVTFSVLTGLGQGANFEVVEG